MAKMAKISSRLTRAGKGERRGFEPKKIKQSGLEANCFIRIRKSDTFLFIKTFTFGYAVPSYPGGMCLHFLFHVLFPSVFPTLNCILPHLLVTLPPFRVLLRIDRDFLRSAANTSFSQLSVARGKKSAKRAFLRKSPKWNLCKEERKNRLDSRQQCPHFLFLPIWGEKKDKRRAKKAE